MSALNDNSEVLKLLDDQFKKSHGYFANSPKELYQYCSNFPEQFAEVNFKQINSSWSFLQALREKDKPNDSYSRMKVEVEKSNDLSENRKKQVFCRNFNSPNGCKSLYCDFKHISPPCCVTMYNVPKHIDCVSTLEGILDVILDSPEFFCVHPCWIRSDCYTIELSSVSTQKTLIKALETYLKDSKDLILTTDTATEAQSQFDYNIKQKQKICNPNVVWEWEGENGVWTPYPSDFIFKLEDSTIGQTLRFKNPISGIEYDVVKTSNWKAYQISTSTKKKRDIRRHLLSEKSNSKKLKGWSDKFMNSQSLDYSWECEEDDGSFSPLETEAMKKVELARLYEKVTIQRGSYSYVVEKISDDTAWQVNLQTSKKRQLIRKNVKSKRCIWEWQDVDGVFKPYDLISSQQIENLPTMAKTVVSAPNAKYEVLKLSSSTGIQINVVTKTVKNIRKAPLL